jgi:hypothetical protein
MSGVSIDRIAVRELVEDFWRSFILFMRDFQTKYPRATPLDLQNVGGEFSRRAWQRFEAIAALMPPEQGKTFMEMIDEEDTICSKEHHFRPDAFYNRLDLSVREGNKQEQDRLYQQFGIDPAAVDAFIASGDPTQAAALAAALRAQPQPVASASTPQRQGINADAIKTVVHVDYEILRQIAQKPGLSIQAAGAEVDAELERMTRKHVEGMNPEQAAQFLQIYNDEYNHIVMEGLQKRHQRQTIGEMAVRTAVRATIWEVIRSLFRI